LEGRRKGTGERSAGSEKERNQIFNRYQQRIELVKKKIENEIEHMEVA